MDEAANQLGLNQASNRLLADDSLVRERALRMALQHRGGQDYSAANIVSIASQFLDFMRGDA